MVPSSISISISENVLHDYLVAHPYGTHIKDANNGNYLLCNPPTLKVFGLKNPKDLIGQNIAHIDKYMRPYWGQKYAQEIAKMDYQVKTLAKIVKRKKDIFINRSNHEVYIQDLLKLPLIGRNNQVTAIVTIATDRTKEADPFALLNLYREMYPNQTIGLVNFVKFLSLSDFFQKNLTYKEIVCLLHMRINPAYKNIAKKLNISAKTVETHVSNIISKLKHAQLAEVLSHLRNQKNAPKITSKAN